MENKTILLVALVLVVFVGLELIPAILRRSSQKHMMTLLNNKDYEGFDAYRAKGWVKLVVSPYAAGMMKLNVLLQGKDEARIRRAFEELEALKLKDQARCDLALRGFYHYLPLSDKKQCRKCIEIIQATCQDEAVKQLVTRFFQVKIEKKNDLLPELLREMEEMEETTRFNHEYLISEIYRNQGNEVEAKRYEALSNTHREQYLQALKTVGQKDPG